MTRQDIIDELCRRKDPRARLNAYKAGRPLPPTHAYCDTTESLTLKKWDGKSWHSQGPVMIPIDIPPGTTLKIVMISQFGDVGLTDDLNATSGYHIRLDWDSPAITNLRWER